MTHFIRSGNVYRAFPGNALDITEHLPKGNYILKFHPMEGFFLEESEPFTRKGKIYGNCLKNCQRILNTFEKREGNTGALLVGEKGSGKTLLARQISIESDMPTIIINTEFSGDSFNSFLASISQPCVVLLDEFEKVYKKEAQESILTLLDGTYQSKKLFILTSNDKWRLDEHMRNRPGRLFYFLEFSGLEKEFIVEYCQDNLINKEMIPEVVSISSLFSSFNFDLLTAIVEECNRYGESPKDLLNILNAKPEFGGNLHYNPIVQINNNVIPPCAIRPENGISVNTTTSDFELNVYFVWDRSNARNDYFFELLNPGESDFDWDTIFKEIASGELKFFNHRQREPFGEGVRVSQDYVQLDCSPSDIVRYGNSGEIVYNPEEGVFVSLHKKTEKKKKEIADIMVM